MRFCASEEVRAILVGLLLGTEAVFSVFDVLVFVVLRA